MKIDEFFFSPWFWPRRGSRSVNNYLYCSNQCDTTMEIALFETTGSPHNACLEDHMAICKIPNVVCCFVLISVRGADVKVVAGNPNPKKTTRCKESNNYGNNCKKTIRRKSLMGRAHSNARTHIIAGDI